MIDKNKRTAWEILGIPPSATTDEVKQAYRNLSKKLHPDLYPESKYSELYRTGVAVIYTMVNGAYMELGDRQTNDEKRKRYSDSLTREEIERSNHATQEWTKMGLNEIKQWFDFKSSHSVEGINTKNKEPEKEDFFDWLVRITNQEEGFYKRGEERQATDNSFQEWEEIKKVFQKVKNSSRETIREMKPLLAKVSSWLKDAFNDESEHISEDSKRLKAEGGPRVTDRYLSHERNGQKSTMMIAKNNQDFGRELEPGEMRISPIELDLLTALDLASKSKNGYTEQVTVNDELTYSVRGKDGVSTISPIFKTKEGKYIRVDDGEMAAMRFVLKQRGVDIPISMKDYFESLKKIAETIETSSERDGYLPPDGTAQTINSFMALNTDLYSKRRPYIINTVTLPRKIMDRETRMSTEGQVRQKNQTENYASGRGEMFG